MADTPPPEYHFTADLAGLLPEVAPDTIISRKVLSAPHLKVTLFGFAPGQALTEHTAAYPAVLHFLAGQATVTLGQATFSAGPGAWVHMPAHLAHSITAETAVTMLLSLITA